MKRTIFTGARLVILLILVASAIPAAPTQGQGGYRLLLPIVTRPPLQITGEWTGAATQTGNVFDYRLVLSGSAAQLVGSVRVSDGSAYAVMPVKGSLVGEQMLLDATGISETNGTPAGAGRWCVPTLLLAPEGGDGLVGTWTQQGCNSGRVYLQRAGAAPISAAGSWNGTATQGAATFGYTLALNQSSRELTGLATTRNGAAFGTMRVRGYAVGDRVIVQETELLQSSTSAWCYKTVELHREGSAVAQLRGPWSALGCVPGEVSITAQ